MWHRADSLTAAAAARLVRHLSGPVSVADFRVGTAALLIKAAVRSRKISPLRAAILTGFP
jgi:hypothetical protein